MLIPAKGLAGLIFMLMFVAVMLAFVPATRFLLAVSIPVGLLVALILRYWHNRKPVEKEENKRPLGL